VNFVQTDVDIIVAHTTTPFVSAYPWSAGFGTKYANPGTLPAGNAEDVDVSTSSKDVALANAGGAGTVKVTAYPWNVGVGFGTKYADPVSVPANSVTIDFSPSGNDVGLANSASPFITTYKWTTTGWGTKYANPGTLPPGNSNEVKFTS
jgi:hypothetical protein